MNILKPFGAQKVNFVLDADATIVGSRVEFEFNMIDKGELFALPERNIKGSFPIAREHELWNSTCFEAFLNPVGLPLYYEFNFSLKPAWNAYQFERTRYPEPPHQTEDFKLDSFEWNAFESKLIIKLQNNSRYTKFRVGLTAVLEEKNGNKHFCALVHKKSTPDFHVSDSFTLLRG